MNDRKLSAKSKYDSSLHNDFPIFQYNTSIIDLKLFPTKSEETTSNNMYDGSNNEVAHPNYSNINTKKYLINKNFRFYQPVKDAQMMVQLDSLRLKLQASVNQNSSEPSKKPIYLGDSFINKTNSTNHSMLNHHRLNETDCSNCLQCKEEEQRQLQYLKLIQNEILRGKDSENDTFSLKSYNLSSCAKKSVNQSPDIDTYTNRTPENEPEKNNHHFKTTHLPTNQNDTGNNSTDFPELKKYSNKTALKQNRNSRIKSSLSVNRLKSATIENKISNTPQPKWPTSCVDLSSPCQYLHKNVQKTVRRSTQSRLKNIYKSSENNMEILEFRSKTPKTEYNDHYLPPAVSYLDIHAPTLISFLDIKDTNSDTNKSISSKIFLKNSSKSSALSTAHTARKYQSTIVINDLINFGTNPRQANKRPLPTLFTKS